MKKPFLPLLLSAVFLTCLIWTIVIPYNEAPDEYTHFDVAQFIALNNRFPVFGKDENMAVSKYEIPGVVLKYNASYSAMPPLAYIWQAGFIKILNFDLQNLYISARIANIFLAVIFVFLIFKLSRKLFEKKYQQVFFMFLAILTPQIIFTFSYVNSDGVLLVFTALIWYWILRFLKQTSLSFKESILFGATIGLAVLTRYNIGPLLIIAAIFFIRQNKFYKSYKPKIMSLILTGGTALLTGGWWYVRNLLIYKDILATKNFWQTYHMIYPPQELGKAFYTPFYILVKTDWLWRTWQSLWAVFGWNNLLLPEFFYRVLLSLFILSLTFLFLSWEKLSKKEKNLSILSLLVLFSSLGLSLWQSLNYAFQPQGRYLFPAWPALIYLFLIGWNKILKKEWQKVTGFIMASAILLLSVYSLVGVIVPAYY